MAKILEDQSMEPTDVSWGAQETSQSVVCLSQGGAGNRSSHGFHSVSSVSSSCYFPFMSHTHKHKTSAQPWVTAYTESTLGALSNVDAGPSSQDQSPECSIQGF